MVKAGQISIDELLPETKKKLGFKNPPHDSQVEMRTLALGKILQDLSGLTNREALWAIHSAEWFIRTSRGRVKQKI